MTIRPTGTLIGPAQQITDAINRLKGTLALKGWPNSRRQDLQAEVEHLEAQWRAYQAGTLAPLNPPVEI